MHCQAVGGSVKGAEVYKAFLSVSKARHSNPIASFGGGRKHYYYHRVSVSAVAVAFWEGHAGAYAGWQQLCLLMEMMLAPNVLVNILTG